MSAVTEDRQELLPRQRRGPQAPTSRPSAARRVRRADLGLLLGSVAVVGVVNAAGLAGWPAFFDDEGTYVSQAWAVGRGELAPYTYWYDHPPVGWFQLAVLGWLPTLLLPPDAPALLAGRVVMVGYALATAVLVFALSRRLGVRPPAAAVAVLLWGLSPLVVFESRQVLLDNMALPWVLGALVLVTSRRRDLWHAVAAGACFGVAVLTKETLLVVAPAVVVGLWTTAYRPTRSFALVGLGVATALTGSAYLLMALLRDELLPGPDHVSLWDGLAFQMGRPGSGFLLAEGSGAHGTLGLWLDHDPLLLGAGCVAAVVCCAVRRLRCVGTAVVLVVVLALRPDGYLPFMYVVAVLPLMAVAVAAVLDAAWTTLSRLPDGAARRAARAVAVLLAVVAVLLVAPRWWAGTAAARGTDVNAAHGEVVGWVSEHLPRDARVVVDNTYWNDLVRAGWSGEGFEGAVWFYKVDLDGEARTALPRGWEDLDFLVWSPTLADDPNALPTVAEAYASSVVLASFGGDDPGRRVEVRQVLSPGERPLAGLPSAPPAPTPSPTPAPAAASAPAPAASPPPRAAPGRPSSTPDPDQLLPPTPGPVEGPQLVPLGTGSTTRLVLPEEAP